MPRANRKTTITQKGIDKAKRALNAPDMPTEDFPRDRIINIINVKQMTDPQIQRCTSNSNQTLTINEH